MIARVNAWACMWLIVLLLFAGESVRARDFGGGSPGGGSSPPHGAVGRPDVPGATTGKR